MRIKNMMMKDYLMIMNNLRPMKKSIMVDFFNFCMKSMMNVSMKFDDRMIARIEVGILMNHVWQMDQSKFEILFLENLLRLKLINSMKILFSHVNFQKNIKIESGDKMKYLFRNKTFTVEKFSFSCVCVLIHASDTEMHTT